MKQTFKQSVLGESSSLSTLLGPGKQCLQWRGMASDAPVPGLLGTSPGLARAALPTVATHNGAQPAAWEPTSCAFTLCQSQQALG